MVKIRGDNFFNQAGVPTLPDGVYYTAVAAGLEHTVFLRSDGVADATGDDRNGQTDIPALPAGVVYTAIAAGGYCTVLLRSDKQVVVTESARACSYYSS